MVKMRVHHPDGLRLASPNSLEPSPCANSRKAAVPAFRTRLGRLSGQPYGAAVRLVDLPSFAMKEERGAFTALLICFTGP